jgi:hypothetical protein
MKRLIMPVVLSVLSSTVVTGVAAWLTLGRHAVTRTELVEYVQDQSPWLRDRGRLQVLMEAQGKNIDKLTVAVESLIRAQQQLLVEQRVLGTRFESLLKTQEEHSAR